LNRRAQSRAILIFAVLSVARKPRQTIRVQRGEIPIAGLAGWLRESPRLASHFSSFLIRVCVMNRALRSGCGRLLNLRIQRWSFATNTPAVLRTKDVVTRCATVLPLRNEEQHQALNSGGIAQSKLAGAALGTGHNSI
jgi:hypothetical protein